MSAIIENDEGGPIAKGGGCLLAGGMIYLLAVFVFTICGNLLGINMGPSEEAQERRQQQAVVEGRQKEVQARLENEKAFRQQRIEQAEQQRQWQEESLRQAQKLEYLTQRAMLLANNLARSSPYDNLVTACRFDGTSLELTVDNVWFLLPKQIRLQHAQIFAAKWIQQFGNDRSGASVSILDRNGNKVGGTGFLGIYVDD